MKVPKKAVTRVDLATAADGEREVDLFRKYFEAQANKTDVDAAYLNELKQRQLNVTANIKNIRILCDVVLMFAGLTVAGTGVLGYGVGNLNFDIIIAGGGAGLLSYFGMIITQYKIDRIRGKIAIERKKSNIYTQQATAKRDLFEVKRSDHLKEE